jgi:hypothetical protein
MRVLPGVAALTPAWAAGVECLSFARLLAAFLLPLSCFHVSDGSHLPSGGHKLALAGELREGGWMPFIF